MAQHPTQPLFVYGMLLRRDLQLDTFGRTAERTNDTLPGYRLAYADIDLPQVVALTGIRQHPVARRTGNALDKVMGEVLAVTADELDAADEYAAPAYLRRRVRLGSGIAAWAYLPVAPPPVAD